MNLTITSDEGLVTQGKFLFKKGGLLIIEVASDETGTRHHDTISRSKILGLEVGQTVIIEKSEWEYATEVSGIATYLGRKLGRKYKTAQTPTQYVISRHS